MKTQNSSVYKYIRLLNESARWKRDAKILKSKVNGTVLLRKVIKTYGPHYKNNERINPLTKRIDPVDSITKDGRFFPRWSRRNRKESQNKRKKRLKNAGRTQKI